MRVVSLIASATEIVSALGCGEWLVGRSHECDFPPDVLRLPACSRPRIDIHGSSREIDQRVKEALAGALSIYEIDVGRLRELRPDVIVTQSHCEVCAVSLADVEAALCGLLDFRPRIVSLAPNSLADVWSGILAVAEALGVPERGAKLLDELIGRLDWLAADYAKKDLSTKLHDTSDPTFDGPRVVCLEWIDPLMAAGNWVPELVTIAGGVALFAEAGVHSPYFTWEQLRFADPEVIAVMPCGWDIAKARTEMAALTARPEWHSLDAVRRGKVYLTDGNQYFNRPGPRLVESAEILAEILHPQLYRFGHEGRGWERF